jgi:hypothetical protein
VTEADKHSLIGKLQRGHELKKKVDSTYKDIGIAQRAGNHPEASKAFRKHERYANLERPGTWTKVDEESVAEGESKECNVSAWRDSITDSPDVEEFSLGNRAEAKRLALELKDEGFKVVKIHPVGSSYKNGVLVKNTSFAEGLAEDSDDIRSARIGDEIILRNKDYGGVIVKIDGSNISFKNESDGKRYKATLNMIDRNLSQEQRYKEKSDVENKQFDDALSSDMKRIHKSGDLKKFGIGVTENVDEDIPDLEEVGEPIKSIMDAEFRLSSGDRIFAFHEMDEEPFEIFNVGDLSGYTYDQLLAVPAESNEDDFMSEGAEPYDYKVGQQADYVPLNGGYPPFRVQITGIDDEYIEFRSVNGQPIPGTRETEWSADPGWKVLTPVQGVNEGSNYSDSMTDAEWEREYQREKSEKEQARKEIEKNHKSKFKTKEEAIEYANDKLKTFKDSKIGMSVYAMPDGGFDVISTARTAAAQKLSKLMSDAGGKHLGTLGPRYTKHKMAETSNYGDLDEAKYQGREVTLNTPMAGDIKKSKVYVKNAKGNVVKVNFGEKGARIKKSNPGRRKSFRARHGCDNPGPKWKAKYWSCRAW